jgi:hypothetical protein
MAGAHDIKGRVEHRRAYGHGRTAVLLAVDG